MNRQYLPIKRGKGRVFEKLLTKVNAILALFRCAVPMFRIWADDGGVERKNRTAEGILCVVAMRGDATNKGEGSAKSFSHF